MTGHELHKTHSAAGDNREPGSGLTEIVYALLGRRVRDLHVELDDRRLVLRGRADSYHVKQIAQHLAMAALGLPLSANEIVVSDFRRETPATEEKLPTAEPEPHTTVPTPHTTRGTRMSGPHS